MNRALGSLVAFQFLLGATFVRSSDALAQPRAAVPIRMGCAACRVQVEQVVRIGADGPEEGQFVRKASHAVRLKDGRFIVAQDLPLIYDSLGRYVSQMGRIGSGPGEFRSVDAIHLASDGSVHVVDLQNGIRRSIWSVAGSFERAVNMPVLTVLSELLDNGLVVQSGLGRAPGQVGHRLHVSDAQGQWLRSFGDDDHVALRAYTQVSRRIARSAGSSFWSAPVSAYQLEKWDAETGRLQTVLTRSEPRFPPHSERSSGTSGTVPTPTIVDLHEDRSGLLWVLVRVAAPEWRRALGPPDRANPGRVSYKVREDLAFHTQIEAIDVAKREVVASVRLPAYATFFIEDRLIGLHRESEEGHVYLDVMRLSLPQR